MFCSAGLWAGLCCCGSVECNLGCPDLPDTISPLIAVPIFTVSKRGSASMETSIGDELRKAMLGEMPESQLKAIVETEGGYVFAPENREFVIQMKSHVQMTFLSANIRK